MTNTSIIAKATLALSLAFAGVTLATPALASDDLPTVEISTDGINLNSPAGHKMVERRIQRAATMVCPSADSYNLGAVSRQRACYKKAVDSAWAQFAEGRNSRNEQVAVLESPVTR